VILIANRSTATTVTIFWTLRLVCAVDKRVNLQRDRVEACGEYREKTIPAVWIFLRTAVSISVHLDYFCAAICFTEIRNHAISIYRGTIDDSTGGQGFCPQPMPAGCY
jgi:hypothetical protein